MSAQMAQHDINQESDCPAGEMTDQSQTQPRRSTRDSSAAVAPKTVTPSSILRVRQKRMVEPSSTSELDRSSVQGKQYKQTKKRSKQKSSAKASTPVLDPRPSGKTKKAKGRSKKGNPTEGVIAGAFDYDQDTDNESVTIPPGPTKKEKVALYDDPKLYFENPVCNKLDDPEKPLSFQCKWCSSICRGHGTSTGNLKSHRDGYTQKGKSDKGCVNRDKAILAGAKLPLSVAETRAASTSSPNPVPQYTMEFNNRVLNQILMMWQIRQALPWSRIEDPLLRVAFKYANANTHLYARRWSADEAKKLYAMLKTNVFEELNNLDTKFTLIHDVWTTKGNRFAFIGAAVSYVDANWDIQVRHLALKMIPWKHCGHLLARPIATLLKKKDLFQKISAIITTDSGSNNNTMASAMYELLQNTPDGHAQSTTWDPTSMHIRCSCHKLALIVNAGLAALSLKILPPGKTKQSVLGFFPVLGKLTEEDEPVELSVPLQDDGIITSQADNISTSVDSGSDYGNADDEISDCGEDSEAEEVEPATSTPPTTPHVRSLRLQELCNKLDGVIKGITRSAAQRTNFDQTAQDMNIKVSPLIAGYGIRWNIKYTSHRKAIDARAVIDQILLNAQEESDGGSFGDACFSPREWKEIDNLNRELEVFVKLTSYMEGNQSTGAHIIPKYLELKESLANKLQNCREEDSLYPMYHAMSKRVEKYLDEAMQCHTLVIATILHPCFRMYIFELAFGSRSLEASKALQLLRREFVHTKESLKRKQPAAQVSVDAHVINNEQPLISQPQSLMVRLASRLKSNGTLEDDEITAYLNANLSFDEREMNNKATPLQWWKTNQHRYPTLAVMARAYLGSVGSSCAVERLFSAAADVCSSNRGRLLPSSMSHCVSSLMWLREEVPLTGSFAEAGKVINALRPPPQ
ncbi:hypothetical protein PSHT_11318 [Puccinia striiformis]|uniref:HAT C-terminal dimerisation domain-containing protein n=1 Tax=Puccinia striiformis TaxID=27350 RepID=A0A2S4UHF0_9BASI|nr:hypothetical protein PSHT_14997 [Puccinia striiformis]POW00485.1 hypothetical protein PSHT_13031 [Puccinia striiformis]POW04258.1 hypothetical protein PSHT_11318 [Puccinia striiformis]